MGNTDSGLCTYKAIKCRLLKALSDATKRLNSEDELDELTLLKEISRLQGDINYALENRGELLYRKFSS